MKNILVINGLLESVAGFILIFSPQLLLYHEPQAIQGVVLAKLYGILSMFFGITTYLFSKTFAGKSDANKKLVLAVITFHFVTGLYMYGVYKQNVTTHPVVAIIHILLAIIFMIMYLGHINDFKNEQHKSTS